MFKWRLFQYESGLGRKAIDDWRNSLPKGLPRVDLDNFLKVVAKKDKWEYPDIDSLKGKAYRGLYELRWKSGNVPHRILGYFKADHEFAMLVGCTHKNKKKYIPPDALNTAIERKEKIANKEAILREYQLITDEAVAG
jgi:hypothetical protein